ncbi:MAG: metalloprotease PmbA [Pseudomonadota bacterium]
MTASRFAHSLETLQAFTQDALAYARQKGASACEVDTSEGFGQSVTVRCGEVETIEYNRDKGLGVTVYVGQRKAYASTSDFSRKAIQETVEAALNIARFTAEDNCAGLADPALMATSIPDLGLYHPWDQTIESAVELAQTCEQAAYDFDERITNSEGATVSVQEAHFVAANSNGFIGGYPSSRHYLACSVIAGEGESMQRDSWYSTSRNFSLLEAPQDIGLMAAKRAVSRVGGRRIKTGEVPVIFEAPLASGLLGSLVHAVSGGALYRKTSFLVDSLGKSIFPSFVNLSERPHVLGGLASSAFDNDGVATQNREVVVDGVLNGYFLSTYTARKLGMETTGNAGGSHNLFLQPGSDDLPALIKRMGRGLLVIELLGHGINYVTGDYSRGAAGFWVENGEIVHPVEEITIAGNLREMFQQILAIGSDIHTKGSKQTGSILIERMKIAGN